VYLSTYERRLKGGARKRGDQLGSSDVGSTTTKAGRKSSQRPSGSFGVWGVLGGICIYLVGLDEGGCGKLIGEENMKLVKFGGLWALPLLFPIRQQPFEKLRPEKKRSDLAKTNF